MSQDIEVEVVLKKKMTIGEYKGIIASSIKKGWSIQAYEIGYHSEGFKTKYNEE